MERISDPETKYDNQYESDNGFLTSVWGPALWFFLHILSLNYPIHPTQEQKRQYFHFISSLQNVLPCGTCRTNLKTNLKSLNFSMRHLKNRHTFSRFMYNLHREINHMLGKPTPFTFTDMRDLFEMFRAQNCNQVPTTETGCSMVNLNNLKTKCQLRIIPFESNENTPSLAITQECFSKE